MGALFSVINADMIDTILGTKGDMQQAFTQTGVRVSVTVVKTGQNVITQVKTVKKDRYKALQLGFGSRKIKNLTKPLMGHLKGAIETQNGAPRFLREVRVEGDVEYKVGDIVSASDILKPGDSVQVTGISKGKGFAGVVKRWGFAGGPKTHGQSDRQRAPGSIGLGTTPGRVVKGKKMAGRMGGERVTVKNLTVLKVDEEKGELWLSGPVPGPRGTLLLVKKTGENKKFEELTKWIKKEENGSEKDSSQ